MVQGDMQSGSLAKSLRQRRLVWHYTTGDALRKILRSGVLVPSALDSEATGERPAVWFSTRRDWDPAAAVGERPGTSPELVEVVRRHIAKVGPGGASLDPENVRRVQEKANRALDELKPQDTGGLARIGVAPETAPYTWEDFVHASRIAARAAAARVAADRTMGSDPADWRVSFDPVPSSKWVAVEVRSGTRTGESWRPLEGGRQQGNGA